VAFDQLVDEPELPDELPLLHPAASTTVPMTAARATPVFFIRTFPPQTCVTALGQDASIVARKREGEVSVNSTNAIWFMNGSRLEEEFLHHWLAVMHLAKVNK
jgi:hypothetical protein